MEINQIALQEAAVMVRTRGPICNSWAVEFHCWGSSEKNSKQIGVPSFVPISAFKSYSSILHWQVLIANKAEI